MKILALKPNPSFLQEDDEWTYEDVQNSQARLDLLTFPFKAKVVENDFDCDGFPIIVDPNGNTWSSDHFIVEL